MFCNIAFQWQSIIQTWKLSPSYSSNTKVIRSTVNSLRYSGIHVSAIIILNILIQCESTFVSNKIFKHCRIFGRHLFIWWTLRFIICFSLSVCSYWIGNVVIFRFFRFCSYTEYYTSFYRFIAENSNSKSSFTRKLLYDRFIYFWAAINVYV